MKTPYILLIAFLILMNMIQPQRILCQVQNVGKAKDIFKQKKNIISNNDSIKLLNEKAIEFYNSGKIDSAIYYGNITLNLCRSIYKGDHPDIAISLNWLAFFYDVRNSFKEADTLYNEALEMYRRLYNNDNNLLLKCLGNMANFYNNRAYYQRAEPLFIEALEMSRRLYKNDHKDLAASIINMADFFRVCGYYNKAESLYIEALEIYHRLYKGDHNDLATSINNMAEFYKECGNYSKAELLFTEALEMCRRLFKSDHKDLILSISNLAEFYRVCGNYNKAETLYNEALEMSRKLFTDDHIILALIINNIAVLYEDRGYYKKAEPLFKEALEMRRRLFKEDHPTLATSINNMAMFYNDLHNFREAEPLFKEALEMRSRLFKEDHPDFAGSVNNLAGLYNDMGNYKEAEPHYIVALDMYRRLFITDHPFLATSLSNLAALYNTIEDYRKAEPYFIESIKIITNIINNYLPALSENEKHQFLYVYYYKFEIFNSFSIKRYSSNPLILNEIYNNCLFTKALLLSSTKKVRERILNSGDKGLIFQYKDWISKKEVLSKYYSLTKQEIENSGVNLDSLENYANELEKELSRKSELFAKEYDKKKVIWQDVQSKLKDNEAAIEIVRFNYYDKNWTDTVYYAALIVTKDTKEHPELVLLKNGNELDSVYLNEYNTVISRQSDGTISKVESDKTMGELYEQFWKPIAEKLKGIKKVYLSLDGAYNQINLETLINPVTKEYLYEEIELHLLTSTRDLVLASNNKPNTNNVADLFGRPNYKLNEESRQKLAMNMKVGEKQYFSDNLMRDLTRLNVSDLPGTETEVRKISKIMQDNGWTVKTFVGDSALEEVIKSIDSPRILHIATHGYFLSDLELNKQYERGQITTKAFGIDTYKAYENPLLRSGLLLAGAERGLDTNYAPTANTDNGILTAYEAMNLNLDYTELVVLSACKTGLGQVRNGEGVYGLQRAFIVAGAKTIIMSLWKVNDTATQELMTSFYTKWLSGMTKREAFKDARNEIRAKYKFPYYWGAFVMVGE